MKKRCQIYYVKYITIDLRSNYELFENQVFDIVKTIVVGEREGKGKKKNKLPRQINLINRSRFMGASRKTRNNITDYLL